MNPYQPADRQNEDEEELEEINYNEEISEENI